ncbi:MAG TPA: class I SAM-dependent methyltransferase [Amycolatopsis sp.]|uniref:class I SAM-dependent methyltransferase n=1 Tax=Amycolatopsis sp. TaxID=37632 RepID=UPI002B48ED24|nr:class I SAM-dependent methyltransferase [Amycolatopsis sp.]HKS43689.1 class I SAM-dependent methyltransferase [Amycolatopsis sp.]
MALTSAKRPVDRTGRPSRDSWVVSQYADAAAASGYAALHNGRGPQARYFRSRLYVVDESLRRCPGGDLLDVGCGPGVLVGRLLDTRPGNFRITACDRSPAMIETVAQRAGESGDVRLSVARIEEMPFQDRSFDVVLATGVLEYADVGCALHEIARVVRPGGLVVVTMLNPMSPYRVFEWFAYWPALRLLGRLEGLLGVPVARRHGAPKSGIRARTATRMGRLMHDTGLEREDLVYYDLTPLVPPFDKLIRRWTSRWRSHPETTVSRGVCRWLGTGYLIAARRTK